MVAGLLSKTEQSLHALLRSLNTSICNGLQLLHDSAVHWLHIVSAPWK